MTLSFLAVSLAVVGVSFKGGYWTADSPSFSRLDRNAKETTIGARINHSLRRSPDRRGTREKLGIPYEGLQDFFKSNFTLGISAPLQQMFPQSIIQFKFINCAECGKEA